ncbi:MAG: sensor histidine kinase [Bacteroidota bacterium]|jgi:signal transduction histidine kinase
MAISDNTQNTSDDILMDYSNIMHVWMMKIIAFYSVVYTFINIYLNDVQQAYATAISLVLVSTSYFIYNKGFVYASKLFNLVNILATITVLAVLAGVMSLMFLYFFPLIIATLIIFQGKQQMSGYVISGNIVILLLLVTRVEQPYGSIHLDAEHLKADQFVNIIGVCGLCILLLFFANMSMGHIRKSLVNQAFELRKKNDQLTAVIYTREKMMSVISHDLRSPIIALNSAMNIFSDQEIDPAFQKEIVGDIKKKSIKLLTMIDDLLAWTKSQSESVNCTIDKISIAHFKEYLSDLISLIGATKKIELELDFNFNPATEFILCDKNLMETILRNLVSNAIKFSDVGSKLIISAVDKNNKCEFSIKDFGKGLTEKQMNDIKSGNTFTTSGTANENGHGLGLQLVQEFLKKQNSELEVESSLGEGSRFYFSVPIHSAD